MTRKHSCTIMSVLFMLSSLSAFAQQNKERANEKQPAREAQKADGKLKLSTDLVSVTVSITDSSGRMVTGFQKEDFEIYDDEVRQEVAFFSNEDAPITLGIVYDISGSMNDLTSRSFQVLRRFFETSHEEQTAHQVEGTQAARSSGALLQERLSVIQVKSCQQGC